MVTGQPEDITTVLANFNAIAAVINGGLDNANLMAGAAIAASKLAGYPSDVTKSLLGDGSWGVAGPGAPVTSLPASPTNLQEVILIEPGYAWAWRLIYLTNIGDAYKWVFLGGSALQADIPTVEGLGSAAYANTATPHNMAIPRAGLYDFDFGFRGSLDPGANNAWYMSLLRNGVEATDGDAAVIQHDGQAATPNLTSQRLLRAWITSQQTVTFRYRQGTASGGTTVGPRWARAVPIRIA